MVHESYQSLCPALARRGGRYPGMGIPEFCSLGCPAQAALLEEKPGLAEVPRDRKALREALEARR